MFCNLHFYFHISLRIFLSYFALFFRALSPNGINAKRLKYVFSLIRVFMFGAAARMDVYISAFLLFVFVIEFFPPSTTELFSKCPTRFILHVCPMCSVCCKCRFVCVRFDEWAVSLSLL